MKKLVLTLAFLTLALPAFAQTVITPGMKLTWDQDGPDLVSVTAYTYQVFVDGTAVPTWVPAATTIASPIQTTFLVKAAFPPLTPGVPHAITLTATNSAGASVQSVSASFIVPGVPAAPKNLRGGE